MTSPLTGMWQCLQTWSCATCYYQSGHLCLFFHMSYSRTRRQKRETEAYTDRKCFCLKTYALTGASLFLQATYVHDIERLPLLDLNLPEAALSGAATPLNCLSNPYPPLPPTPTQSIPTTACLPLNETWSWSPNVRRSVWIHTSLSLWLITVDPVVSPEDQ